MHKKNTSKDCDNRDNNNNNNNNNNNDHDDDDDDDDNNDNDNDNDIRGKIFLFTYKLLVVTEIKTVPCLDSNSIVIMIRFGTLHGGQLLLMCHKFFSGDNLILSHTVMIIIDSKKQKIRQLHINEAGGKIKGFLLGLTHVF